jgi:hypothetical protein
MKDTVLKLMEGAYDVHMHATPGLSRRRKTILQIAEEAKEYGMRGVVYKDHHFSTAPQASIVNEVIPEVKVIGGVTLNGSVGGVNPAVVESTFKAGGKVVWMFSLDSAWMVKLMLSPGFGSIENYRRLGVRPELGGYSVFRPGTEELTDEAREIVALCKQYGGVLETSHLSVEEGTAMIAEGKKQGLTRMVVTHANQSVTPYAVELQKSLVRQGAFIMYCMANYMSKPGEAGQPVKELTGLIRQVGSENVVLGTDFGLHFWPSAVEGMRMMISCLLEDGLTEEEIAVMVKINPERLYGE